MKNQDTRSIYEVKTEIRRMGDCLIAKILMDYKKTCERDLYRLNLGNWRQNEKNVG